MNKRDLVKKLQASFPHFPPKDIAYAANTIFAVMIQMLNRDERIEIRKWGSISIRTRRARTGWNPKTGNKFTVMPRRIPFFKASNELLNRINGTNDV